MAGVEGGGDSFDCEDADAGGKAAVEGAVTGYGPGYPRQVRALGAAKRVRVGEKDCAVAVLLVAK